MRILNVRLGLATNSSSTHSLIVLPNGKWPEVQDGLAETLDFGWGHFTAFSAEKKLGYLAVCLYGNLAGRVGHDAAEAIARQWTGSTDDFTEGYIDHQSMWDLPADWSGKAVDKEFFHALKDFILQQGIVILGGNDNTDVSHPLKGSGKEVHLKIPEDGNPSLAHLVCRQDGPFWTLFNRESGSKWRMTFDHEGEYTKSQYPELVDIKITDFCPYNCAYCYQDSTAKGKHADIQLVHQLAAIFGKARVFEVAIGGGEPTLHPEFLVILKEFRRQGIVPNFTTRNISWLRDDQLRPQILELGGAFAVSVDTVEAVNHLADVLRYHKIPFKNRDFDHDRGGVVVQYVMGTLPDYSFESLLTTCRDVKLPITLLGYKDNGRGMQFRNKWDADDRKQQLQAGGNNWVKMIKKMSKTQAGCPSLSIDTALAAKHQEELAEAKLPSWLYHVKEGKFSMYVDLVEQKIGPSSYCEPDQYVQLSKDRYTWEKELWDTYANW